jgi:hypothetical protein
MLGGLGGFFKIPDHEIDRVVDHVLADKRVEKIARRIAEMILTQLTEGLAARDAQQSQKEA